ncbi:hypothetical protein FAB82_15285 [Glycomyces buryatensis]|uniref:Uncharacterized protein n=1 Tax=Glycomyces buryatensis TaxID=2570927 RepID=A0A4S8Q8B2_9ACTN|nr:hypothetical protein FAB82_15285 [Glycomyces buryatensis]
MLNWRVPSPGSRGGGGAPTDAEPTEADPTEARPVRPVTEALPVAPPTEAEPEARPTEAEPEARPLARGRGVGAWPPVPGCAPEASQP